MRTNKEENEQVNAEVENKEGENSIYHSKIIKTSKQIVKKKKLLKKTKPIDEEAGITTKQLPHEKEEDCYIKTIKETLGINTRIQMGCKDHNLRRKRLRDQVIILLNCLYHQYIANNFNVRILSKKMKKLFKYLIKK